MRALPFVLLLAACTATSDLTENVQVDDNGDHLSVFAYFSVGGDSDDGLHDVDSIAATFRGEDHDLACNEHGCSGTIGLETPPMADEPLVLAVHRGGDTLVSSIMIPARVDLEPAPLFVSRAEDFSVMWSPPTTDNMSWRFESDCVDADQGSIAPNLTMLTLPAGSLQTYDSRTVCTSYLTLTRYREVPGADGFAGGHVGFVTEATTNFASTP